MGGDMTKLLEVENLKTHFFSRNAVVKAVDGVTFDLEEGESLALVGESGCGKSVTAMSIMRLIPSPPGRIVAGAIRFMGQDLLQADDSTIRSIRGNEIGMVFQEPMTSLNPVLSIERQLSESVEEHLHVSKTAAIDRAAELLDLVGIPGGKQRLKDYPHQFSGGMRQRVMIAMALSCNPKLLIADEPTTALDVTIQAQVLELIRKVQRELGVSVIIITHNLGVVARYVDRINVMYAGRIVERGKLDDIFEDPQHPYTKGLLASVPRLDRPKGSRLVPIDGMPPDLSALPEGCAFRERCTFAIDQCATDAPTVRPVGIGEGHEAACWVADQGAGSSEHVLGVATDD
jgi:oligopeptide/dipeptide ABC transporter ATP-binding protein